MDGIGKCERPHRPHTTGSGTTQPRRWASEQPCGWDKDYGPHPGTSAGGIRPTGPAWRAEQHRQAQGGREKAYRPRSCPCVRLDAARAGSGLRAPLCGLRLCPARACQVWYEELVDLPRDVRTGRSRRIGYPYPHPRGLPYPDRRPGRGAVLVGAVGRWAVVGRSGRIRPDCPTGPISGGRDRSPPRFGSSRSWTPRSSARGSRRSFAREVARRGVAGSPPQRAGEDRRVRRGATSEIAWTPGWGASPGDWGSSVRACRQTRGG